MNTQLKHDSTPVSDLAAQNSHPDAPTPPGSHSQPAEVAPQLALLPPHDSKLEALPVQQPPAPAPQTPRKLSRNGKIARLPYLQRDLVNRLLRNNIPYAKIVAALEEHDVKVTQRNVSNWKTRGGYKEWCAEVDRALENRLVQDNLTEHLRTYGGSQLPEIGLQAAATNLSRFLLSPAGQKQLDSDPQAYSRTVATLCRLSNQILALQKYRDESAKELGFSHNPEHIRREEENHFEITRSVYSAAKLGETIDEPNTPHRNYIPKNH